jgi:uroporphyrinogen-III synthase
MSLRVLVTRPQPGGDGTAARLQAAGYEPIVMPLTEIIGVAAELPSSLPRAVAISSANAVRHAPASLVSMLARAPVFAVGDKTAAAARQAGFAHVRSSASNAADLARDIVAAAGPEAPIVYVAGRVRLDALEVELAAAGCEVRVIETYDTRQRAPSPQEMTQLEGRPVDFALVYSTKGADSLARLVAPRAGTIFADTAFICISQRIAQNLSQLVSGAVSHAATPDENAMFDLLPPPGHEPAPFRINVA